VSGSDAEAAAGSPGRNGDPELAGLLSRWRADLAGWAIPDHILSAVPDSPWVLPGQVFARRADKLTAEPSGPSFDRAWAALDPQGSVLDVGSGPGAACLPLLPRTTELTAVDVEDQMLALLAERTKARGVTARCVTGRWPDVAPTVPAADVVTCHHVLYNVPDLEPFLIAVTNHARRQVIVEIATLHPLTSLNEMWLRFHNLRRPDRPTAEDVLAILRAMGVRASHQRWRRPGAPDYASFAELTDVTRRRLCLPQQSANEVSDALIAAGVDPEHPQDLGSSGRDVMTMWWAGSAQN
jgi:2-polyprenyl-3-methyl-5-hydroxy-6-metoxy-1,4-benzoquinol methylase